MVIHNKHLQNEHNVEWGDMNMKKKNYIGIVFMILLAIYLFSACSNKILENVISNLNKEEHKASDKSPNTGSTSDKSFLTDGTSDKSFLSGVTSDISTYTGSISDIEYSFILWSFRDQVVSDFKYMLTDADKDGCNELLISAVTDERNMGRTQFIADSNYEYKLYWGFTPTGAAQGSDFCTMKGYDTILWNENYSTLDYMESHYHQWTGSRWEEIKELDGLEYDYDNTVKMDSPNLLNIKIEGDSEDIFEAVERYFDRRGGAYSLGEADLDGDKESEMVYYVLAAANDWYEGLRMKNTTDNQSFQDHRDIYMTVVIADKTSNGVVLRPVRVKYRGANIKIVKETLFISDMEYRYTDKESEYANPCLQTVLKSPGTYGDFDSQGNRTIMSMLYMPFYDICKMCTQITLFEKSPGHVTATFGKSRCRFDFIIISEDGLLGGNSPAQFVGVDSWKQLENGPTIDPLPLIGDFCMGDTIGELRTIMVPSTEWKALRFGQSSLANTNFYYRPSYENKDVYYVSIWTDGEGEDSKVCSIEFEYIVSPDAEVEKALGIK